MAQTQKFQGTARRIYTKPDPTNHHAAMLCYRYHNTDVVTLSQSPTANNIQKITLNTGGYRTNTTKLAINQALNELNVRSDLRVYQKNKEWFLGDLPFHDGMTITKD